MTSEDSSHESPSDALEDALPGPFGELAIGFAVLVVIPIMVLGIRLRRLIRRVR